MGEEPMIINFDGKTNTFSYGEALPEGCNEHYSKSFLRYLNSFYKIYKAAFEKSEFSALLTLFAFRGYADAGWDPYESSVQIINSIKKVDEKVDNYIAKTNLHLWLYGHIMEASEPYEKIMNLLDIITGEQYMVDKFPSNRREIPQTPGQKILKIIAKANALGFSDIQQIYKEIWDRELRNSIFHSDYSLYGNEIRINKPCKVYNIEEVYKIINYASAYFEVIKFLHNTFIGRQKEPKVIEPHPNFKRLENEKVVVIVREGYGAIGIKHNWSLTELKNGAIPYWLGRFYPEESKLLNENPLLAKFPSMAFNERN